MVYVPDGMPHPVILSYRNRHEWALLVFRCGMCSAEWGETMPVRRLYLATGICPHCGAGGDETP